MSDAQREAQRARRQREKEQAAEQAAMVANAAADAIPDEAVELMTDEMKRSAAEENDSPEQPKTKVDHSARMAMLGEIKKIKETEDAPADNEFSLPEENVAPQPEQVEQPEPQAALDPTVSHETIRVKIDGEEFDVPKSEIDEHGGVAAYRINKAAEKRLQKAADLARQQAEVLEQMKRIATPPEPPKPSVDELIKAKVANIQFGTTEEAAAAIKEIIEATRQPTLDPVKIRQEAVEAFNEEIAAKSFISRNQDILGNRVFAQLAILTQNDMINTQGKPKDWNKFYSDLEGKLRTDLGKPPIASTSVATQPTSQPPSGSVADKEARKASIVALPVTAARAAAPEEQKQPTREDTLARLRKARGQPV